MLLSREALAQAYHELWNSPGGQLVILDLVRFCHFDSTTHVEGDPYGSAQLEGRRQVFLRIYGYASLRPGDIAWLAQQAQSYSMEG